MEGVISAIAAIARNEEICVESLKKANATSQENAVKPEEVGVSESALEKAFQRRGKVKKTEDDRYYVECRDKKHC